MNLYHFSNKRKLDKVISHLRFSYKEKEKPKEYVNWRKPSHQLFTNVGEVLKSIIISRTTGKRWKVTYDVYSAIGRYSI